MKDKIISFILILIAIGILVVIGIFGYIIYTEIMENGTIQINFESDTGFPKIEYKPSIDNATDASVSEEIFTGDDSDISTSTTKSGLQNKSRYLYKQLDSTGKAIYDKLYENKENLKTGTHVIQFGNAFQTLLSTENGDDKLKKEYQSAIEALVYENPDMFYIDVTKMYINIEKTTKITGTTYNVFIDNGNDISYLADGFYSKEDVEEYEVQINQVKNQILSTLGEMSAYQKIKTIHDYLIDTIEYEDNLTQNNIYDIYGALVAKKCVCEGYAKTFQYLMNEIGIDNTIVIGTGTNSKNETENHAWNYVQLNGKWYAVDVTWDDPVITGVGILTNKSKYRYFLKGSNTMAEDHVASGKFTKAGQIFEYPELSIEDYKQ